MRRRFLGVLGWLVAVVVATGIGLTAVSLLSKGLTANSVTPLSQDSVAHALARTTVSATTTSTVRPPTVTPSAPASSPSSEPQPSSGPSSGPSSSDAPSGSPSHIRTLSSAGGTLIARCHGDTSYLVSWSPAQGWKVDDYERGPAPSTTVSFEGATDDTDDHEVAVTVTCSSGEPVSHITADD